MDKESERAFVEAFTSALVSLPFDMKVLVEAVVDPDLSSASREIAAATLIHMFNPKDGHVEAYLRHAEDVVFVRLALKKIVEEGTEASRDFQSHWSESFEKLDAELASYRKAFGDALIDWMDGRWAHLRKGVYSKKPASAFVKDEELAQTLYDHASDFSTDYPVTERSVAGRVRQLSSFVEHLQRKRDQDKLMIHK
ncbi:MAG: hypothetical protein SF187_03350 [Deltaproteobacteria bacterium]|nr:hypothetical protein [Deltaproteobacteria bacterium]